MYSGVTDDIQTQTQSEFSNNKHDLIIKIRGLKEEAELQIQPEIVVSRKRATLCMTLSISIILSTILAGIVLIFVNRN